jgi:signal transduction histidine kinase
MTDNLNQYLKLLFSLNDPIYYSIVFTVLLFILLYLIFKYVVHPMQKKYKAEKMELELKNARLMALFAELDPDPVIRINMQGEIIYMNNSAAVLVKDEKLDGRHIKEIIPIINFPVDYYILNNRSKNISYSLNSKNYSILFKGISSLEIAQLYFHDITEKIEYENKLKELSASLQNKIEEDRQRIARELHDDIGQNLLILKMNLINKYRSILNTAGLENDFQESIDFLQKILLELKIILYDLKPPVLEEMGLNMALSSLINKISGDGLLKGSFNVFGVDKRLNPKVEITLYRIVQEAINNILKHSYAKEFSVQLIRQNSIIKMLIYDDGIGFNYNNNGFNGYGLINMRERVESFKGNFKIESSNNNGTLLVVEIPVEVIE